MAVTVSIYANALANMLNKLVGYTTLKTELLSNSASFTVGNTSKEQVDNGSKATITMTIASPAVVSWTAHGFSAGQAVQFLTTGALPTGLTIGTWYYVLAAGLVTNAFEVSATPGGAAINTTGAQSGVHTGYSAGSYEVSGNAWPVGGPLLTGVTFTTSTLAGGDGLANDCTITATNVDIVASGGTIGPAYNALIYDSATNLVLFFIAFGQAQSAGNTTDFKIVWNASGIFTFTV
jgi:hypothetical protein